MPKPSISLTHKDDLVAPQQRSGRRVLSDVVISSNIAAGEKVEDVFNGDRSPIMTSANWRGERTPQNKYRVASQNNQLQIREPDAANTRVKMTFAPGVERKKHGYSSQNAFYIGVTGMVPHLVNVPPGKYAKARVGNEYVLLGPGAHVIPNANFALSPTGSSNDSCLVDMNSQYIQHGPIHIIRPPNDKVVKVRDGSAKTPHIIEPNAGDPGPYVYCDTNFKLIKKSRDQYFFEANAPYMKHDSLHRFNPRQGAVILYKEGNQLKQAEPNNDGDATIVDNPNIEVDEVPFSTQRQDRIYPGENEYKTYITGGDRCEVGVRLFVNFKIPNPAEMLSEFGGDRQRFEEHLEHLVETDINRIFTNMNLMDALSARLENAKAPHPAPSAPSKAGGPPPYSPSAPLVPDFSNDLSDKLKEQLKEIGVELNFVRLDPPEIKGQLKQVFEKLTMDTTERAQKLSTAAAQSELKQIEVKREQDALTIQQNAENARLTSAAEAQRDADLIKLEAKQKEAELYASNPAMLELRKSELQARALERTSVRVLASGAGLSGAYFATGLAQEQRERQEQRIVNANT